MYRMKYNLKFSFEMAYCKVFDRNTFVIYSIISLLIRSIILV